MDQNTITITILLFPVSYLVFVASILPPRFSLASLSSRRIFFCSFFSISFVWFQIDGVGKSGPSMFFSSLLNHLQILSHLISFFHREMMFRVRQFSTWFCGGGEFFGHAREYSLASVGWRCPGGLRIFWPCRWAVRAAMGHKWMHLATSKRSQFVPFGSSCAC